MRIIHIILGILALAIAGKPLMGQENDSVRIIYRNKTVTVKPQGDESYTTVKFKDTLNNKKVVVKVMVSDNKGPKGMTLDSNVITKNIKLARKNSYGENRSKFIETDFLPTLDLGFVSSRSLNTSVGSMKPDLGRSANVSVGILRQNMNLHKGRVLLSYGIGINAYSLKYKDRQMMQYTDKEGLLKNYTDSTLTYSKNKTNIRYLSVPVLLEYHSKNNNFNVAAGVEFGFNGKSKRVLKGEQDGNEFKYRSETNIAINPVQVSAVLRVGIDRIAVFGKYNLSAMYADSAFEQGKNPDQHLFSFGICLFGI